MPKKEKKTNHLDHVAGLNPEEIPRWKKILYAGGVSKKHILFFTKNLSVMLKAGSTLAESIAVLKRQTKGKLFIVLTDLSNDVTKGRRLSESLEKYPKIFSEIYTNIIRTGEESGNLEKNLEYLANQLNKSMDLRRKVIGAMIYPAVVLIGTLALGLGIVFFILPQITKLFKSFTVELPITTRLMIRLGSFIETYGVWVAVGIAVFFVFVLWILRLKLVKPVTHFVILMMPIVRSLSRHLNLSMFYRNLSILLASGVTIDEAMLICSKTVTNYHYKRFLHAVHVKVKEGSSLTSVLKTQKTLFPETDIQIISVGEESGTLSETLSYSASIHEDEVDSITKNLSNILEPVLLIILGLMVGTLALSIITPIYSISSQLR